MQKNMKILIVTHYFLPHRGGIEFVAYNQAKELVKRGHEVTIVSSKIGDEPEEEILDGIRIKRVKAWNWFEEKQNIPYPVYSYNIFKSMKKEAENMDIIHVHDLFYLSSFAGAIASKKFKKPLILMQHVELVKTKRPIVNLVQRLVYWTYGRYIIKKSNKILVCNNKVKDWIKEDNKSSLIDNAVNISLFQPTTDKAKKLLRKKYNLPQDKPIILFVGRFVEKKGFDKLFEARDNSYFILAVGEGIIPDYMKKEENVKIMDFLEQDKLAEIYQASDIFCLPSENEGFPLTILEAMASGLPIITSDNPGYEHYLNKDKVVLIKPEISIIKSSIKALLSNKKKMNEMREYSRQEAVKRFGWEKNTKKIIEVYNQALKEHENIKK